ncbi:hypothetical protein JOM56_002154 [Amanita muscaria]
MGSELPPLPPHSPRTESHGSPKPTGRHRRHSTTEREVKHLRDLLLNERKRADEAEARTHETLSHLKVINEARIKALHEATQAMEELKLYKIQLETAQREIYRAQDVLKVVDRQRLDAEKEAADLRSKNRRLIEEARLQRAREQGRVQGMKEGLEKGRDFGLLEGRLRGYTPPPPDHRYANRDEPSSPSSQNSGLSSFTDHRPSRARTGRPSPRPRSRTSQPSPHPRSRTNSIAPSVTSRRSVDTRAETPIPVPPPAPVSTQSSGPQGANHSTEDIRPVSVHNRPHPATFIPPDNYIPVIDADNVIRLPPPHEFQRSPSMTDRPMSPQHEPEIDDRQHRRSTGTPHRRARRHSSPESDSTTISQMDLVNDPERNPGMRTPMSAILEVSSSQASPDPQPARGEPDLRPQPSFAGSMKSQRSAAPPSGSTDLRVPIYSRPRTTSGSTISMVPPQEVQHQPSQSTLNSAPPISVQPPSSPSSTGTARSRLQQMSTPSRGQPSPLPAEPPNFPSSSSPPEQTEFPSPIVLSSDQLPAHFVPMSYTPATAYTQLQPANEEADSSGDGPPVIPDSALFGTDSSEDSEGASSMDTLTTPPTMQRPLDQQHRRGASVASSHHSASQAPGTPRWGGSTAGGAAQVPLPPSTIASNTPRWDGTSIGKASSTKSRSRSTKRAVS